MRKLDTEWKIYRTRFLIRAKRLTEPLVFVDALGREHRGQKGDYLVESSDGTRRVAPREIFEDIYVPMRGVSSSAVRARRSLGVAIAKHGSSPTSNVVV